MAMRADGPYVPYPIPGLDAKVWREDLPSLLKALRLWNRYAPRAKGWLPRLFGRLLRPHLRNLCVRTKHGALLAIEPSSLNLYLHMLNYGRTASEEVLDACTSCLAPGQVFYDVGANIGYISIEAARVFDGRLTVVCFEPQPWLAQSIAASAALNGFRDVAVFDLMVSDQTGEADLYLGSHSNHASAIPDERWARPLRRRAVTIDELVDKGAIPPPHVIKLDVEGGELSVLKGAVRTIARYRPHMVFESDSNMARFGYTRRDLIQVIRSAGAYDFRCVRGLRGDLVELDEASMSPEYTDILARPRPLPGPAAAAGFSADRGGAERRDT